MDPEIAVWVSISLIGLLALPFVWRRRRREEAYVHVAGETPARELLNESRRMRALALTIGVICGSLVPIAIAVLDPSGARRIFTIVFLIAEYVALVGTLILDEWYSARIDRLR